MRKLQKAALVIALAGGTALAGAAPALANSGYEHKAKHDQPTKIEIKKTTKIEQEFEQENECRSHDTNVAILNNVGILSGALANLLGGEGDPGAQFLEQGSDVICVNEGANAVE